jgi:hypothetical protein
LRRHHVRAQTPHDGCLCRAVEPPQDVAHHDGQAVPKKVAQQYLVGGHKILEPEHQSFVHKAHVQYYNQRFKHTRHQSGNGRALYAQRGEAKIAEYQKII